MFLRGQINFYVEQGLQVWVATRPDERLTAFAAEEGATPVGVPMNRQINPIADIVSIWNTIVEIRKVRPDIVHAHTPKGGLIGTIAARIARVPIVIYHIRGLPYMEMAGWKRRLMMSTEWIACKLATEVFCVSHSIAEVAIEDKLVSRDKIHVFLKGSGNGVDANGKFNPERFDELDRSRYRSQELRVDEDSVVVLYVGRLAKDKGLLELSDAWAIVSERIPDARLVLVGHRDERDPISQDVMDNLRNDPTTRVMGNRGDTAELYASADLIVLPTYREGFPNVLLEAAAMALPVVATRIPGCIDAVVDGVTGRLVEVKSSDDLAVGILELIQDKLGREKMGTAARSRVLESFESRKIWEAIYDRYRILMKGKLDLAS